MTAPKNQRPELQFELSISGEVESGSFSFPVSEGIIKFAIVVGDEVSWGLVRGDSTDCSCRTHSTSSQLVWNLPFSCVFASTTCVGWPRMVISLTSKDWFGREILLGYGSATLPVQPGRHSRKVDLFVPVYSCWWTHLTGTIFGKCPFIKDPETLLAHARDNRDGLRVKRVDGTINVNFNILIKGADTCGLLF